MRFSLADKHLSLWLRLILPAVALAAAIAHFAIIHGQNAEQLSVYSAQSNYSVPLIDVKGLPYVGLVDLFEPLGDIEARPDGKKYKLRFTPPGGHAVEAQFNEGKDKAKILGGNFKLPADFVLQNGRGYVPLSSAPEILSKLLAKPVQLHPTARRMFVGDVPIRFSLDLDKSTPPKLTISFPSAVNPSIATEPGHVRFTFKHEPVVSNGQDSVNFDDPVITGAVFAERDGLAELDIAATAPLIANFADGGKTIIVSAVPPPPSVATVPAPQLQVPAQIMTPQPKAPTGPRFLVLIDPAHGGSDSGASITPSLVEKDVVLALARRVQRDLEANTSRPACCATPTSRSRSTSAHLGKRCASGVVHLAPCRQHWTRCACLYLDAAGGELVACGFLPWDTAQAAFLDLSGVAAGSVAAELDSRKLPNTTLVAPLRPMNNIAAPAIAVEIAPPDDDVDNIAAAEYQEQVAQSIAAGIAAVRSKLPEVRP